MELEAIMVVFGKEVAVDFSNVKTIFTKVIPNIGEEIVFENNLYKVYRKIINYTMVEKFGNLKDEGRGGEVIYIFV